MIDHSAEARRLNDLTRTRPETVNASWVMMQGALHLVAGMDESRSAIAPALDRVAALRAAIAMFSGFTEGQ